MTEWKQGITLLCFREIIALCLLMMEDVYELQAYLSLTVLEA